jgi:hypothetical protein
LSTALRGTPGKLSDYLTILEPLKKETGRGNVSKAMKEAAKKGILRLATERGYTVGKWMIFLERADVDDAWASIARATYANKLGCAAKVSPPRMWHEWQMSEQSLICVYVDDFNNKKAVKECLLYLRNVLGLNITFGFKPDVYTFIGSESKKKMQNWRLDSNIYSVLEVTNWRLYW